MNIDLINESTWTSVIQGTRTVRFEFLALQLFLVNLRNRLETKELSIEDCIRELKGFYRKFNRLPMAEKDFSRIAKLDQPVSNQLLAPEEVARRIAAGQSLMLAGEEKLLAALPPGNWIGGTIPYFMTQDGGCLCKDKIFVTEIPAEFQAATHIYSAADLRNLFQDTSEGTVSFVILPADSQTHTEFALNAPGYPGFALHPLLGWVAGVDLSLAGTLTPKVFCGSPQPLDNAAAVMRMKLPADRLAQINIINLFEPGDGDTICFPNTDFSAATAAINGKVCNFAQYLEQIHADTRLPLIANYCGAMVNVGVKSIDSLSGRVEFYAPVAAGISYKLAKPVKDYVEAFQASLKESAPESVLFSCNCILNYLYSKLEGHRTGAFIGPVTFGEIAFQLLNQTLVYLEIIKVDSPHPVNSTESQLSAALEELQASEQRFNALSESAPLGIFLTNAAGRVLYENRFCRKLAGVRSDETVADSWLSRVHPIDLPGVIAALAESERSGGAFDHEFRFVKPNGDVCWVLSQSVCLRSPSAEITGRVGTLQDITSRKEAETKLERANLELIKASRDAGIAEVTNGVLHNVKNVINSINVSASVIADQVQRSKSSSLSKVTALLREHTGDLGSFVTNDPRGRLLPAYLDELAERLNVERAEILEELRHFEKNVQHIKDIVNIQQGYARTGGAVEKTNPIDLMEDSLRINAGALSRHGIQVIREYDTSLPEIPVEKHKVLQILVNFICNSKQACQASERTDKKLILKVTKNSEYIHFVVKDNGIGIHPENLPRVFEHGFTTKKEGHGFGLHSGVLAARELGGEIHAHSDGVGQGATFTVKLPLSGRSSQPQTTITA